MKKNSSETNDIKHTMKQKDMKAEEQRILLTTNTPPNSCNCHCIPFPKNVVQGFGHP